MSDWSLNNSSYFSGTDTFTANVNLACDTTTTYIYDTYRDWLPNSCLYEKYIPTWHLVRSYK